MKKWCPKCKMYVDAYTEDFIDVRKWESRMGRYVVEKTLQSKPQCLLCRAELEDKQ